MDAPIDPVMTRFRAALAAAYGDRIERVVLFGSRARGDAQADSDYDVAVFLKDMQDFGREMRTIARLGVEFLDDDGAVINALPFREGAYRSRTAFMSEVRRDGRDLWARDERHARASGSLCHPGSLSASRSRRRQ